MTREEARQIIATWLVSSKGAKGQRGYIEGWFDEEDAEAFRMAIEALKAEPVHGDLISRQAAIDEALTFFIEYLGGAFDEDSQRLLVQRMNSLPSVDITETETCQKCQETTERVIANAKAKAEPRHGEWVKWIETIEDDTGVSLTPHWKCSICNTEYDPYFANRINYCPNCGAKMYKGEG